MVDSNIFEEGVAVIGDKKFSSLEKSLAFWFLLLAMAPLVLMSWISYQQANATLTQVASDKLEQSAKLNARFVQNWFDYRFLDLESQAEADSTMAFYLMLLDGVDKSSESASDYVGSYGWALIVDEWQGGFVSFWRRYDYIDDVLLVDLEGSVLFSASGAETLGSNLAKGPYANSRFAHTVKYTLETGESQFSDLERYPTSTDPAASFLVAMLQNEVGDGIGVIAIQIRLDRIVEMLQAQRLESVVHYLVGEGGLLRTSRSENRNAVLDESISTDGFLRWRSSLTEMVVDAREGPNETPKTAIDYIGPDGSPVIGFYQSVQLSNVKWALFSEVDRSFALTEARWFGRIVLASVVFMGFIVLILAVYLGRRITLPIKTLSDAAMLAAAGELDHQVEIEVNNEIGRLSKTFNHMLTMRQIHEQALEKSFLETRDALSALEEQKYVLDQHTIVAITDVKGSINFVNAKFSEISGYTEQELLGKNHRLLNSGHHEIQFWRDMYLTVSKGQVWHAEVCNKAKDGRIYWVDTTIVPFLREGKSKSYVAIRNDITELKRIERELVEAMAESKSAALAKSEFLASMSHEIRTPMNGVLGMLRLLLNSDLTEEQYRKAFLAKSSAESLLQLINDILDFSKVDAGKLELEELNFDVLKLLGEFSEGMALRAQEKGLEIILDVTGIDQPMVKGDPGRIRQILTNLIGNSIKFTESGEILIRVRLEEAGELGYIFTCQVRDTGMGIPEEKQDKLFDQFTQVDTSTTRQFGGTGLGLSIVKRLCELMGGSISVLSAPGEGSSFEFSVVLLKSDESPVAGWRGLVQDLKILIVDDNETTRKAIRRQMEHWGVAVKEAISGTSALSLLDDLSTPEGVCPFDAVFVDMQMPHMDGLDVGKAIRTDDRFSQMKLIIMTSMDNRRGPDFFTEHGFNDYFPKPATSSDLYDALMVVTHIDMSKCNSTRHHIPSQNEIDLITSVVWPDSCRLLLVEDNQINQEVALGILGDLGLSADIASDGREALTALSEAPKEHAYTVVLMDCQMPEMDGYQATQFIREGTAGARYKTIPIIAMTANAMKGDKERCLSAGMSDYLTKPVEPDMIKAMLLKWILAEENPTAAPRFPQENNTRTEEEHPIWDKPALLKRLGGKEERMVKLVGLFFKAMPDRMIALQQAVQEQNIEEVLNLAHAIKGVVANLGGVRMQHATLDLETAAKTNEISDIEQHMLLMDEAYRALTESLSTSQLNPQSSAMSPNSVRK